MPSTPPSIIDIGVLGVPGLGLNAAWPGPRDRAYATGSAVTVRPHAAPQNFARLAAEGGEGLRLYEAIDYTPSPVRRQN